MYLEDSEIIKSRMLEKVANDLNKSEGTFLYDSISPISEEIAQSKLQLDEVLKRVFATTAAENGYSEELEKRAAEYAIYRKEGNKASGKVKFYGSEGALIPKGTIVQTEGTLQYKTLEDVSIINKEASVGVEALNIGTKYNVQSNLIKELPIQILGITSVINEEGISGGTEEESDEELLNRLLLRQRTPGTSGNANHYKLWATEIAGIGDAKVFPLWNGAGSVKVVVVDSNKHKPNETLLNEVKNNIEINRPIGAAVTVIGASEKQININAKVVLSNNYTISQIQSKFYYLLEDYFKEIAFSSSYISYAKIGNILLSTPGVLDYSELKVNNSTINVGLQEEEIPIVGALELGV